MSKQSNNFSFQRSDLNFGKERWISHDGNGHFAGEFKSEKEARRVTDLWNNNNGNLVVIEWVNPPDGAPDSHRGDYYASIKGTNFKKYIGRGWHSMEDTANYAAIIRNNSAKHGMETVEEIIKHL